MERFYGPWAGKTAAEKIIYISDPTWGNSISLSLLFWVDIDSIW